LGAIGIDLYRLLEQGLCHAIVFFGPHSDMVVGPQDEVVDGHVGDRPAGRAYDLGGRDPLGQSRHDGLHHLVLDGENVLQVPVVALRPDVIARCGVDQLGGHPDTLAAAPHAAFDHVAHAELAADLRDVDRRAAKHEGGVAGDDEQQAEARQLGDDVLGDAVGEVVLLRVARHVGEGQHRDRRLVGDRERLFRKRRRTFVGALRAQPVDPNGLGDILHLLFAAILEGEIQLAVDRIERAAGNADAAGLGERFQSP
jgi:hypothetical protein